MAMKLRPRPGYGMVRINRFSGIKKLMRAARRGKMPAEYLGAIARAVQNVARDPEKFMNARAKGRI